MADTPQPSDSQPASADRRGPTALSEQIDGNNARSWQRWLFPGIWLFYLTQTAAGVATYSHGAAAVLGYVVIVAFGASYLLALAYDQFSEPRKYAIGVSVMCALLVVEAFFAHEDATAMCVYIGVVCISGLGRWGWPAMGGLTVLAVFGPALVPSWHASIQWDMAFTMGAVGLAMYGFFAIMRSNRELSAARTEVARLAAENERSRIARDLHDLLGHSLTTITVKAGLARRLVERDPQRAAQEIGEVEELTRSTLTDVRAAVAGYRDITLSGELATAQEVLRAAGIEAHTPRAIDIVPAEHRELFAWVVREGVTNVMRHSRAAVCTISVGANWLEIADDGRGGSDTACTGLRGLRERVDAAGGTVQAGGGALGGWTVRVELPVVSPARVAPITAAAPREAEVPTVGVGPPTRDAATPNVAQPAR
jgi:two-component system, NarL family, sensor histidine kinase DesK